MKSLRQVPLTIILLLLVFDFSASAQNVISTVAGGGQPPSNVPATAVGIATPRGVAVDNAGNLFITATGQNFIFKVDHSGLLTTFAGNGTASNEGDGGPAQAAGFATLRSLALDSSGNLFIADSQHNRIRRIDPISGVITTVAGNGLAGFGGDGGPAVSARLNRPVGLALDSANNLFIADTDNERVRRVDRISGIITTIAGNGVRASSGDGGLATNASLNNPNGVAVDGSGNVIINTGFSGQERRVDAVTGIITRIVGTGALGFSGDGGPATTATLLDPISVIIDKQGNLFIADTFNNRIRRVDAATGIINTIAGTGLARFDGDGIPATAASLNNPNGLALDADGNLYIADTLNNRVRRVDVATGIISTVAGGGLFFTGDGGPALKGEFTSIQDLRLDNFGGLLLTDQESATIIRITPGTRIITNLAGNGTLGFSGDGVAATNAALNDPAAAVIDQFGNLIITDTLNNRIRKVDALTGIISTIAGDGNLGFNGDGGAAISASLAQPLAALSDRFGNVLIADTLNNRIRRVDAVTGIISTIAGNGVRGFGGDGGSATAASINLQNGGDLALDPAGNLLIAEGANHRIRRVDAITGIITTVAGNGVPAFNGDGGLATSASLNTPTDAITDAAGNLFIADSLNNRVRRVDAATGIISTVAGTGILGFSGDGGAATSAELALPASVITDNNGNLFIDDFDNHLIRQVTGVASIISTCNITLLPSAGNFTAQATVSSFSVSTGVGCPWGATSSTPWITILSGGTCAGGALCHQGNGQVSFALALNTGPARTASIAVGLQQFNITQAAFSCHFSVNPAAAALDDVGGDVTFVVTTPAGCSWTAASNTGFLTFLSGASGSGTGRGVLHVAPNTGPARMGTATIAGQPLVITQGAGACGALDVTSDTEIQPTRLSYLPFSTYFYTQTVNVTSRSALPGPLFLVLVGVPNHQSFPDGDGVFGALMNTNCFSPQGDALFLLSGDLQPGQSAALPLLFFTQSSLVGIRYSVKVLSGLPNK